MSGQWGYVLADGEEPVFISCYDEAEARKRCEPENGIPHYRKLASRRVSGVQLVLSDTDPMEG